MTTKTDANTVGGGGEMTFLLYRFIDNQTHKKEIAIGLDYENELDWFKGLID